MVNERMKEDKACEGRWLQKLAAEAKLGGIKSLFVLHLSLPIFGF